MANYGYVYTGKTINVTELVEQTEKILKEKFNDGFRLAYDYETDYGIVYYAGTGNQYNGHIALSFELLDEEFPEMRNRRIVVESDALIKKSVIGFRHGHNYEFLWWLELIIAQNLALYFNAQLGDDAFEERYYPDVEKYSTYKKYVDIRMKPLYRGFWYNLLLNHFNPYKDELKRLPKDLIEKLNLKLK